MKPTKKKPVSEAKKQPSLPYKLKHGLHYVLVNEKTGKFSSSSNWLTALAAVTVLNGANGGLPSLLPQAKAKRLLAKNNLDIRVYRGVGSRTLSNDLAREQAKAFIPVFAVLWEKEKSSHRPPRRGDFCRWIAKSLQNPQTQAYKIVNKHHADEILRKIEWRWWLDRLEKMQS